MGVGPKTQQRDFKTQTKVCKICRTDQPVTQYAASSSFLVIENRVDICNSCFLELMRERKWDWKYVDKFCQYADIPFVPQEWNRMQELAGNEAMLRYAEVFQGSEFEGFGWEDYYQEFLRLRDEGKIDAHIPELSERRRKELQKKWDGDYSDDEFERLEALIQGMLMTQNINTGPQMDQALKICKLSLEIDSRIRAGGDGVDKLLASYEKLVKIGNFTPKNSKNASNFESTGELFKWLEAGGWKNKYYDGATRDIIDETIKNIQSWNQRLYINETGIGEEIAKRIDALKLAKDLDKTDTTESYYDIEPDFDKDTYEIDGYNELLFGEPEEEEEFITEFETGEYYE